MIIAMLKKYLSIGLVLKKYYSTTIWSIFKIFYEIKNNFKKTRLLKYVESIIWFASLAR
jgi:hypothetical protein